MSAVVVFGKNMDFYGKWANMHQGFLTNVHEEYEPPSPSFSFDTLLE